MNTAQPSPGLDNGFVKPLALSGFRRWIRAIVSHPKKEKSYLGSGLDKVLSLNLLLVVAKHLTMTERVVLALESKIMLSIMTNKQFWLP